MTIEREALKLALDALENPWKAGPDGVADAITAIKEALTQLEQECPNLKNCNGGCFQCEYFNVETGEMEYPVAPPEQEPTSELHSCPYAEEIHGNYEKVCDCDEERTRQCAKDI